MPERAHPPELREPTLQPPVVLRPREEVAFLALLAAEQRAGIGPHLLDAVLSKPALNLGQRVSMFFRMIVLIATPRLPSLRVVLPFTQDWIERNQSPTGDPCDDTAQAEWDAREGVVETEHDHPARPCETRQPGK